MFKFFNRLFFGNKNNKIIKKLKIIIDKINAFEEQMISLTDQELSNKTLYFRDLLSKGKSLDDILPEAFAVVREASKRTIGLRHFDVQLLGGIILHKGCIAEMSTGEGKTLVETLPSYLNALEGKGVHIVTINDYLADRDAKWMGEIFRFLGLTVGCILHNLDDQQRRMAYLCDITYGTNNEFGFDYLRDNMKHSNDTLVQRPFNYAIIDEVDSILIDEARTPLIISGPTEDNSDLYVKINKIIPLLDSEDYDIDEKSRNVTLTDIGTNKIEQLLIKNKLLPQDANLYDIENVGVIHHINQALRAHKIFNINVDYMIKDNQILIIDEFTGRAMEGRRYSEGLHQALEAKENVPIRNENQTLASITFQNYFRLYPKIAGMTGTAMTEAEEFLDIYKLEVIEIPPNKLRKRIDHEDKIYRTNIEKYDAIIEEVEAKHKLGQPILVGTVSIEKSELISSILKKKKIKHHVLNAKYHEQEAHIIAQAGRLGAVTIATNMAGRGTDIMLGGNPEMLISKLPENLSDAEREKKINEIHNLVAKEKEEVLAAGGLLVIGTERHESRRIDNQLRGRSGRQGDPGASQFYLSLEDDLMRIFSSDRISGILERLGLKNGESIHHPMISRALERAQQKVEARNFEIRKNLLRFDDVANDQRKVVYEQRFEIMKMDSVDEVIQDMQIQINEELIENFAPQKSYYEQWDKESIENEIFRIYGIHFIIADQFAKEQDYTSMKLLDDINLAAAKLFNDKKEQYGSDIILKIGKQILLYSLDQAWKDHLLSLDHLRQGISLRAYGQKDPLVEYKREAFELFEQMLFRIRENVIQRISHITIAHNEDGELEIFHSIGQKNKTFETRIDPAMALSADKTSPQTIKNHVPSELRDKNDPSTWGKVSRNELCPCESGKKYKHCHGNIIS